MALLGALSNHCCLKVRITLSAGIMRRMCIPKVSVMSINILGKIESTCSAVISTCDAKFSVNLLIQSL